MRYLVNSIGKEKDMQIRRDKDLFADMEVGKDLEEFLDTLFMKMPSLTFAAHDYTSLLFKPAVYDDQVNLVEESEWRKVIVSVRVYNGIEEVGFVRVDKEVYRSDVKQIIYQIRSDNHRLNKGRNDTKKTKDIKEALKRCLKVFANSPEDKMVKKRHDHMASEANNMVYWAGRAANRVLDDQGMSVIEYFRLVKEGATPTIPPAVDKALSDSKIIRELDTAKLAIEVAEAVSQKRGIIVGEVNGKIAVADLANNTYRTIDSSYDLPEVYQAKFAMLKIIEERQPVAQIGVKVQDRNESSMWYFLMSGDILTTC